MMLMTIAPILAMLLSLALPIILSTLTSSLNKPNKDRELISPFECGFSPSSKARLPFSLRFFLLTVLFLIFDIEIIIIMPLPILLSSTTTSNFAIPMTAFILFLTLGLFHEWNEGSLDWA